MEGRKEGKKEDKAGRTAGRTRTDLHFMNGGTRVRLRLREKRRERERERERKGLRNTMELTMMRTDSAKVGRSPCREFRQPGRSVVMKFCLFPSMSEYVASHSSPLSFYLCGMKCNFQPT